MAIVPTASRLSFTSTPRTSQRRAGNRCRSIAASGGCGGRARTCPATSTLPSSKSTAAPCPPRLCTARSAAWREAELGASLLILGFPLGFHDTLHHLPVARQAVVASSYGLRFQGQGYFLTDARTHRGSSGAPVVMRASEPIQGQGDLPWLLLGVHSSRLDVTRDLQADEALGLNCAWYADILLKLTES